MADLRILLLVLVCVEYAESNGTIDDWIRLTNALFSNYSKEIYPVYNFSDTLSVDTVLFLLSIVDFDEVSGVITLSAGMTLSWYDYRLRWTPSEYGGIEYIEVNSSKIWKPKPFVITAADDLRPFGSDDFDTMISYSGLCVYSPGKLLKSTCSVDMTKFPVDTHSCQTLLMSWDVLKIVKLTFNRTDFLMTYFTPNGEWNVDETVVSDYMGYGSPSRTLDFTLQITRRHIYFTVSLTIPIMLLCILNPFVFLLPASSGERISYTITMFLSLAVYMTLMGDNLPKVSENMAGMSYFLLISLIYSSMLILLTIFTLRCEATEDIRKFPRWLRRLTCYCRKTESHKVGNSRSLKNTEPKEKDAPELVDSIDVDEEYLCVQHKDVMGVIDKSLFIISFLFNLISTVWFLCVHYT